MLKTHLNINNYDYPTPMKLTRVLTYMETLEKILTGTLTIHKENYVYPRYTLKFLVQVSTESTGVCTQSEVYLVKGLVCLDGI